jgi:hypothetical protein
MSSKPRKKGRNYYQNRERGGWLTMLKSLARTALVTSLILATDALPLMLVGLLKLLILSEIGLVLALRFLE